MSNIDLQALCHYARSFSRLEEEKIALLHAISEDVLPLIPEVTEAFYQHLQEIPKVSPFLEGRLDSLKQAHQAWLAELFTSDYGVEYTEKIYRIGDVHVKVRLPVEFMAGAMTIILGEFLRLFNELYRNDPARLSAANAAINSAIGFSLLVMQESYQSSTLAYELERFLHITGMSRTLFNNLARAYN